MKLSNKIRILDIFKELGALEPLVEILTNSPQIAFYDKQGNRAHNNLFDMNQQKNTQWIFQTETYRYTTSVLEKANLKIEELKKELETL